MNRREALATTSVLMAGSLLGANEQKIHKNIKPAYGTKHTIVPLSFDPQSLDDISEKIILSHHQNNYSGAVKKLNLIQKQIASLPDSSHPIEYGALKKEELIALNSKLLHELYFANLGGNGVANKQMKLLLSKVFGSYEAWKYDFIKTAKSLSGGSGWVILTYIKNQNILMHQIASDHSDSIANGSALLVLDMYEHSYHMDYGTKVGEYINAFIKNINWNEVLKRFEEHSC